VPVEVELEILKSLTIGAINPPASDFHQQSFIHAGRTIKENNQSMIILLLSCIYLFKILYNTTAACALVVLLKGAILLPSPSIIPSAMTNAIESLA